MAIFFILMFYISIMYINNYPNTPKTAFKGYDARKLHGFIMNSNYAGIASDMKKIGDIEGFKVYLFSGMPEIPKLKSDNFNIDNVAKGCWAQDMWGIVKNTLITCEDSNKADLLKKTFNLQANPLQDKIRNRINLNQIRDYLITMLDLPYVYKNGKPKVELTDGVFLDTKLYDAEIKINKSIYNDLCKKTHIKGGNYFITKDKDGNDELLIGSNELKKFKTDELKEMFQTDKIHVIPQADYHIDLFLRPLTNKKVLLADDEMMVQFLKNSFEKIQKTVNNLPEAEKNKFADALYEMSIIKDRFKNILKMNPYSNTKEVEKALIDAGYEPIKVPGRIFDLEKDYNPAGSKVYLRPLHNYLNANVHINDKNELIYITNRSTMDAELGLDEEIQKLTGVSLRKAFCDAIKPHVNKIYFVGGRNNSVQNTLLREYLGGIHCVAAEIPSNL